MKKVSCIMSKRALLLLMLVLSVTTVMGQSARFTPTHEIVDGRSGPTTDPRDYYVEVRGNECCVWIVIRGEYKFPCTFREIPSDNGYRVFRYDERSSGRTDHIHIYEDFSSMYIVRVWPNGIGSVLRYYKKRE